MIASLEETFGPVFGDSEAMAADRAADPRTGRGAGPFATTEATYVPASGWRGLMDPSHSALFWVGLAALLGLILVTGQLKVSAVLNGRGGKR